jgi:hypothetical protein
MSPCRLPLIPSLGRIAVFSWISRMPSKMDLKPFWEIQWTFNGLDELQPDTIN